MRIGPAWRGWSANRPPPIAHPNKARRPPRPRYYRPWKTLFIQLLRETLPKAERLRRAQARAYEEALHRYSNELLDDEEHQLILDRIKQFQHAFAS